MTHILYFVGAGLSKALAKATHPVPAMLDFVSTCAKYISDDVILTTLTQLEEYDPYPYRWRSPEATQFAQDIVEQRRKGVSIDRTLREKFAQALRNRRAESIEDLLVRSEKASASREDALERFEFAIRRVFTLIGWNINWSPLTDFLTQQPRSPEISTDVRRFLFRRSSLKGWTVRPWRSNR